MAYVAVVQLKTPIAGFERYGLRMRLEGTDRKSLTLELESPLWKAGADFDYHFKSVTDFVSKVSVRTPLTGYESFTIDLSNQLVAAKSIDTPLSLNANAEARFAHLGLSCNFEATFSQHGMFNLALNAKLNEKMVNFKTNGRLDGQGISCYVNLTTPFTQLATLDGFVHFDREFNRERSRGMGLNANERQLLLILLDRQLETGLWVLTVHNPWQPVDLAFSWENQSVDLIHYHAQFCWDLHRRTQSTIGARLIVNTTSYGREVRMETVMPHRRVSLDYALQLTSTKLDHSIGFSWAPERKAGYRILVEDRSGLIRLDLPARSFQLQMESKKNGAGIDFIWGDATQRIGARIERQGTDQIRLILQHPSALEQDIILTTKYSQGQGLIELIYSPLPQHRFLLQGSAVKASPNGRRFLLSVLHPVSHTDLLLQANTSRLQLTGRIDYSNRFIQFGGKVEPEERRLSIEARTAEGSMTSINSLTANYGLHSRTIINDIDALIIDARIGSSSLQLDTQYAGGKAFNFYAGMPHRRELMVRATRDIYGRQITDGIAQLSLNATNLLSSRLNWRSASVVELRHALVDGLIQVLATCQLIADDVSEFALQEWTDKRSSLIPTGRQMTQQLTNNLNNQLNQLRSEFNLLANEWSAMYQNNDFYIQDVLRVASIARPYLERSMTGIANLVNALTDESVAIYRAAQTSIDQMANAASAAYLEASVYVTGAVKESVRSYNQLIGRVMQRLIKYEAKLGHLISEAKAIYFQLAGRLEEIIMERVEELRNRFIELVNSYADQFQPWIEYLNQFAANTRAYYQSIIRAIEGIF